MITRRKFLRFIAGLGAFGPPVSSPLTVFTQFLVAADFDAYFAAQRSIDKLWQSTFDWTRMSILNIAHMAWFSSDRTIGEYAEDIWAGPFETPGQALAREQGGSGLF